MLQEDIPGEMDMVALQVEERPLKTSGDNRRRVASVAELAEKRALVVKTDGKQIVLFQSAKGIYACNNRCPHEGYPLREGTLSEGCILTCNWHNWKFDLESGETLVGGDQLRRYPVSLRDGGVWVEISDPPAEVQIERALTALRQSFRRMEYDRMAREVARLERAGGDPLEALRQALVWTHDRFEFGTTHAIAAAPDWLALGEALAEGPAEAMAPLVEAVAHLAWDSLREPHYPYPEGRMDWSDAAFLAAVEAEDETTAVALARGALAAGLGYEALRPALARAALAHYADFGHSAIYVLKTGELLARLGPAAAEPLLLVLVRSLIYASREDLIPEFRNYGDLLSGWRRDKGADAPAAPQLADFHGLSARQAMAMALSQRAHPAALYDALLGKAAWNLLHFDRGVELRHDNKVDDNIGWLGFTHALTFANAGRRLAEETPDLWPNLLLQMAAFVGRNNAYVDAAQETTPWRVAGPVPDFLADAGRKLLDHGQFEYIVTAHLVKTLKAVENEVTAAPDAPWRGDMLAALNRFLHTPLKRKHVLRTMQQSRDFVAREG